MIQCSKTFHPSGQTKEVPEIPGELTGPEIIFSQLSDMFDYARTCFGYFNLMFVKKICKVRKYKHNQIFRSLQ